MGVKVLDLGPHEKVAAPVVIPPADGTLLQ
jgi:hypothetical protein